MNKTIFFPTPLEFREWLLENHSKETELSVGFYKVKSGIPSMTWSESVDQALCFGWIDGVRRSIDESSYQIRFSPRRKKSIWSPTNLKKIKELLKEGIMVKAGKDIYESRSDSSEHDYSFRKKELNFPNDFEMRFRENKKAWDYFSSLAPSYRKISIHWVISAVQEKTKNRRLDELIESSCSCRNKWKDSKYKK